MRGTSKRWWRHGHQRSQRWFAAGMYYYVHAHGAEYPWVRYALWLRPTNFDDFIRVVSRNA